MARLARPPPPASPPFPPHPPPLDLPQIAGAFDNPTDARRALREIALLRALGPHDNVVAVRDVLWPPEADAWLRRARGSVGPPPSPAAARALPPPPALPTPRFDDVYVLYELMDTDLHQIIRSKQPLTDEHAQFFVYQLLRGLRFVHSGGVLHRDLKPSNLLVNASCDLKIADFGLARAVGAMLRNGEGEGGGGEGAAGERAEGEGAEGGAGGGGGEGARGGRGGAPSSASSSASSASSSSGLPARPFLTEYVVTRWYRAPELLLGASDGTREGYGAAVDVWSAGCVLAELLGRAPLFAGRDYIDQLQRIVALLGVKGGDKGGGKGSGGGSKGGEAAGAPPSPSPSPAAAADPADDASLSWVPEGRARAYVAALPRPSSPPDWAALFPRASRGALDLLRRMLALDPRERIGVDEALSHEWLAPLADPEGEPVVERPGAVAELEGGAGCGGGGERRGKRERRAAERERERRSGERPSRSPSSSSSDSDDGEDDDDDDDRDAGERLRLEALVEMMHYSSASGHAERLLVSEKEGRGGEEAPAASSASAASAVEKAASGLAAVSLSADASS